MRVIAGSLRGRRLSVLKGRDIRPTPDRVREALFSILQSKLGTYQGLRVLDLFAGSGALAIEALSRGAANACLVEKNPDAIKVIHDNIEKCQLSGKTKVVNKEAFATLQRLPPESFNLIFLDPPYGKNMALQAINAIDELGLLGNNGFICAETGSNEELPVQVGHLHRIDRRQYGAVMINFYAISDEACHE